MDAELKKKIEDLIQLFDQLSMLYNRKVESMEPFINITLVTAKIAKLDNLTTRPSATVASVEEVINSFTPALYQAMEPELHQLISASRYDRAETLFKQLQQQVTHIHSALSHEDNNLEPEQSEEALKVAEMMAAFRH